MLYVLHEVNNTIVEWDRVQKTASNVFERSINAQVAYDACMKLELKMLNIGMEDIRDANKKLMNSVLWQLLKIHQNVYTKGSTSDENLLNWTSHMTDLEEPLTSFSDPRFASSNLLF